MHSFVRCFKNKFAIEFYSYIGKLLLKCCLVIKYWVYRIYDVDSGIFNKMRIVKLVFCCL